MPSYSSYFSRPSCWLRTSTLCSMKAADANSISSSIVEIRSKRDVLGSAQISLMASPINLKGILPILQQVLTNVPSVSHPSRPLSSLSVDSRLLFVAVRLSRRSDTAAASLILDRAMVLPAPEATIFGLVSNVEVRVEATAAAEEEEEEVRAAVGEVVVIVVAAEGSLEVQGAAAELATPVRVVMAALAR